MFKHQYDKKIHHKMLVKILSFNSKKKIITIIMNENNVIYLKMLVNVILRFNLWHIEHRVYEGKKNLCYYKYFKYVVRFIYKYRRCEGRFTIKLWVNSIFDLMVTDKF